MNKKYFIFFSIFLFIAAPGKVFSTTLQKPLKIHDELIQTKIQAIADNLSENSLKIEKIHQDLSSVLDLSLDKTTNKADSTGIDNLQSILPYLTIIHVKIDGQAQLLKNSRFIIPEYKRDYYKKRISGLISASDITSYTLDNIKSIQDRTENPFDSRLLKEADEIIISTVKQFKECIDILGKIEKISNILEEIQPAVVSIITCDSNNVPVNEGTGFFLNTKGHIITNFNLIRGASHINTKIYDGSVFPVSSVIGDNILSDLAILSVDIPESSIPGIVSIKDKSPKIGSNILTVGSFKYIERTSSTGTVSSYGKAPHIHDLIEVTSDRSEAALSETTFSGTTFSETTAGCPFVDMDGKVIGIGTSSFLKKEEGAIAVPGRYITGITTYQKKMTVVEWNNYYNRKSTLKVQVEPTNAQIKILNIKPSFYQGILLDPGKYEIEVSAEDYWPRSKWVGISPSENKTVLIHLMARPKRTYDSSQFPLGSRRR